MSEVPEEIEGKILEIDLEAMVKKLESLGAVKVFEGTVISEQWDYPDMRLKASDRLLRLRAMLPDNNSPPVYELTFKEGVSYDGAKRMKEPQALVSDIEQMRMILAGIGFVKRPSLPDKQRILYKLGPAEYAIDTYPGVPPFIEPEAHSMKEFEEAVLKIGYKLADLRPWNSYQLLAHYGKLPEQARE